MLDGQQDTANTETLIGLYCGLRLGLDTQKLHLLAASRMTVLLSNGPYKHAILISTLQ